VSRGLREGEQTDSSGEPGQGRPPRAERQRQSASDGLTAAPDEAARQALKAGAHARGCSRMKPGARPGLQRRWRRAHPRHQTQGVTQGLRHGPPRRDLGHGGRRPDSSAEGRHPPRGAPRRGAEKRRATGAGNSGVDSGG